VAAIEAAKISLEHHLKKLKEKKSRKMKLEAKAF